MSLQHKVIEDQRTAAARRSGFGYRLLYFLGFTPWDHGIVQPELVELIEGPAALPPGRALDLGCGGGTQAIYLAQHGWQVTGVDYVDQALATARQRAAQAKVAPRWVQGDVTRLTELDLEGDYTFLFDSGCFHGLNISEQTAYAAGVTSIAARGATLLIFGFAPHFRGPAPRGISREDLIRCFGTDWELVGQQPARAVRLPPFLRRANPMWYRLQRT